MEPRALFPRSVIVSMGSIIKPVLDNFEAISIRHPFGGRDAMGDATGGVMGNIMGQATCFGGANLLHLPLASCTTQPHACTSPMRP